MFYNPHKKIAFFFLSFALILAGLVLSFFFFKKGQVTITIIPLPETVFLETTLKVVQNTENNQFFIKGEFFEVDLVKETVYTPRASLEMESRASGEVVLINNSGQNQTLIKTTQLLSPEKILFRLAHQVVIPAKGKVRADVYADQLGKKSEIGPTSFTIPRLSPSLQKLIYAESDKPMTGGIKKIGIIAESDLQQAKESFEKNIEQEGELSLRKELQKKLGDNFLDWKTILLEKTLKINPEAKPNEEKGEFKVKGNLKILILAFKEEGVLVLAREKLKEKIPEDKKLISLEEKSWQYKIKTFSLKDEIAEIEIQLKGKVIISAQNSILDLEKIRGLDEKTIKDYFEQYKEIEAVKIKFYPFWIKKAPSEKQFIEIKIEEITL